MSGDVRRIAGKLVLGREKKSFFILCKREIYSSTLLTILSYYLLYHMVKILGRERKTFLILCKEERYSSTLLTILSYYL